MENRLDGAEKEAWIAFFLGHAYLLREIDDRLKQAGSVSLAVYDALLSLEMAPGNRLRMHELAEKLLLTRGGITRMIDRLVDQGYILRESCCNDRRVQFAVLTEKGLLARQEAWKTYEPAIKELFADSMTPEELNQITAGFKKVLSRLHKGLDGCPVKQSSFVK